MNTVFVVNPMAGQGKKINSFIENIKAVTERLGCAGEIYLTKAVGDATVFVRNYCKNHGAARFIACGGDGTLGEVVNGAMACENSQVGVIPLGTGNDFCRNFGSENNFSFPAGAQALQEATGKERKRGKRCKWDPGSFPSF